MPQALVPVVTTTQPQTKCMKRAALMWNTPAVIGLPGRDKPQEATSITTALVLAGNDRIFCPHKPHQRSVGRAQEHRHTSRPRPTCHASSVCQSRMQPTARSKAIATATDSPTVLLTTLHMEVLFASLSRHPPSTRLGRSLRTIAALRCRDAVQCAWQNQGQSSLEKKVGYFTALTTAAATAIATMVMVNVQHLDR